ncbi:hypothetical protein VULLAG_LOCUS21498 [Vulpes lagopus]
MRPGAPLLAHSGPGRRLRHSRGRRLLRGPSAASRPVPPGAGKGPAGRSERSTVQQPVPRVVRSSCGFVCHHSKTISSSTATPGKCIRNQVTESAGGHLSLP